MEHPRHHPGDGVRCRSAVNVKGNLAVEGGFGLQDAQNDLGNAAQTVGAVMWKTLFEVGGERVNMGEGSSGLFHTPYGLPFVVFSAFWAPFFLTCQVLSISRFSVDDARCPTPQSLPLGSNRTVRAQYSPWSSYPGASDGPDGTSAGTLMKSAAA